MRRDFKMNVLEQLKELDEEATKQWELEIKPHGFAIRPDIMWNGDCSVRPREENLINTKLAIALRNLAPAFIKVVEAAKVATEKAPDDIWHFSEMEGWKVGHMPHWLMDLTEAIAELDKEV